MINQKMQIQEFNQKLVENKIDISIIDYVKHLNELFFNIDIQFIDQFISLVDKDECVISHEFLKTCGITQLIGGSSDVKKILNSNNAVEEIDYIVELSTTPDLQQKITYVLHPTIFKKILIRSRNTDKYADYYLLLEKCIFYYSQYEKLKLLEKIKQDNTLKLLLLNDSDTLDNFAIYKCDENTLYLKKKLHEKGFYSLQHNYETYPYVLIKGSNNNIQKILKANRIDPNNQLIKIRCASQVNLTRKIKEILGSKFERKITDYDDELDENKQKTSVTRFFKLIGINENEFIEEIMKIHLSRGIHEDDD